MEIQRRKEQNILPPSIGTYQQGAVILYIKSSKSSNEPFLRYIRKIRASVSSRTQSIEPLSENYYLFPDSRGPLSRILLTLLVISRNPNQN